MGFVHLQNHSEYSLLNGAIRLNDLVRRAKEMGMNAVGITDYGHIFGAVEFYLAAKKEKIKPIIGATLFHPSNDQFDLKTHRRGIDQLFNLVLIITNKQGYLNLSKLITKSYLEGFYYKPRIDTRLLTQYSEGLIALSGGLSGAVNHFLFEGNKEKAREWLRKYAAIYPGRFYVELQDNGIEGQADINAQLIQLAKEENLPLVASNNCHYLHREDAEAFETLLCIQTGATLHGANDHLKFSTDGYYFKTPDEMAQHFSHCPEALENTQLIADSVDFSFDLDNYHFPKFEPPEHKTLDQFLREVALAGLQSRWPQILEQRHQKANDGLFKEYEKRLLLELEMIQKMGFSGYFLIVSDFIRFAKGKGIPVGPGRGSAAGSLVAYCVSITDIDPLQYNLLFERFLNLERISMPDVDIDFCMRGRDEVLKYVAKKYGNVSQIITFGKMKARAVIRDVGRVMEMPYEEVDKIAKLVPSAINITLEEALEQEPRLKELMENDPQVNRLMEIARKLEGLNRHASTHAAGVVISDKSLDEFVPLYKGGNNDIVTQFDMKAIEKIGLIKFDFLGLKTLTIIQDCLRILKRTKTLELDILSIPIDDKLVYETLSKGDTPGVFQLESAGMKDLLIRMKPSCFEDLIALVALYRPGPLGSGMVDDFINRKQGKTPIVYDLPDLKGILEETYGVIVYQEQVMQIASKLAGYSLGEADILRRAMGKKKAEEMDAQRIRFLEGCNLKKIPKAKAEKIFDLMAKFAEYGFNKSHSAAYALVAYQTAYLKAHYPVEFLAAILTNEMHDTDRVLYYIQDCEAHGIKIFPPDVNESYHGFSVVDEKQIRYGLGAVKGVGEGAIACIIEARKAHGGKFVSFFDFLSAIDHRRVNKRVIESLIKCGGFDSLGVRREDLMASMEESISLAIKEQQSRGIGQNSLFELAEVKPSPVVGMQAPSWTPNEKLAFEKEALGFYFSGHPLKVYESEIKRVSSHSIRQLPALQQEAEVMIAGLVTQLKVITTKKGARMAFATFVDLHDSIEVIFFSDCFQKCADLLSGDKPLLLKGVIDRSSEGHKIIARELVTLREFLAENTRSVHFKVPTSLMTEVRLKGLNSLLNQFSGSCRCYLHVLEEGHSETILELPQGVNLIDSERFRTRVETLFEQNIVEYRF